MTEITRLGSDIQNCTALIDESIAEFNERIAQRCNDEKIDLRQSLVRFYKPGKVKEFAKDLDKDQTEQSRQTQGVRLALIEQLSENPGFATFHARIPKQRFFDVLEVKCEANAKAAHDNLIATNRDRSPLFGVNIVGTLEREFSGNAEGLRTFIHDLVSMAGNYLDFDPAEVNRVAPGIPAGIPTRVSQFMVIIPKPQEHGAFAETLNTLFRQQLRGDIPTEIIESDERPNEITLVGVTNLFPLRYVKPLAFLKERYEERLSQTDKPARVKLELHCEGDGTQYPELFVPSRERLITKSLPYVMLAKTLGIIQPLPNQATGTADLYLVEKDEYNLPKQTRLGKSLTELFETVDTLKAQQLEEAVEKLLAAPDYQHQDKRAELKEQIRQDLAAVLADRRGNVEDPVYVSFTQAARTAMQLLQANR